jgi:hypothetical protein
MPPLPINVILGAEEESTERVRGGITRRKLESGGKRLFSPPALDRN